MTETADPSFLSSRNRRARCARRDGSVVLLFAVFLTVCIALLAFSIDLGMAQSMRTDLQRSADSAALAGARDLIIGGDEAIASATAFAKLNAAGTHELADTEIQVEVGRWDKNSREFNLNGTPFDAVRVTTQRKNAPFFFGRALGRHTYDTSASAVATAQPRDMMLVLDVSGSMANQEKMIQLKKAVRLFASELQRQRGRDRVGVAVYSTEGSLLSPLTFDIPKVDSIIQGVNPEGMTNISEGMTIARSELQTNARAGAAKLIVLLTDGLVNQPVDASVGRPMVVEEARKAADANLPIVTISFSAQADPTLMREVADITDSVHFHVEGNLDRQERDLREVFLKVAANRPLQLVD